MHVFERVVAGRRYRIAAQSLWDPAQQRPFARQVVLGPADPPGLADLSKTQTIGTRRVGDVGSLLWVAEQLDIVGLIDRSCGAANSGEGPSVGEMVLAVAVQRTCAPAAKRSLPDFIEKSLPRVSCLPAKVFTGQAFSRLAARVSEAALDSAQIAIARAAAERFELAADVLAFDSTNFDTFIATTTKSELARRGHAKSKRADLRVVGLAVLASETGHVPLLHRTYPGNDSDQSVLESCLQGLRQLHDALGAVQGRRRAQRTIVRDGGFWREQLELDLETAGYGSVISLPLGHGASEEALIYAAHRGKMQSLRGSLSGVRAARIRTHVGSLDRTLVVVESEELRKGQRRGIAVALRKAKKALAVLQRRAQAGRINATALKMRVDRILAKEYLSRFVVVTIAGTEEAPELRWDVDRERRNDLERTRLGRRVLSTDRHSWSNERIVRAFRGQWNVEELFRRAKKGGVAAWGPSYQRRDSSLRLHTFATVLGLTLVSLARLALRSKQSAAALMKTLARIRTTLVRTTTGTAGRRPTVMLPPDLSAEQRRAVQVFELERWLPSLLSCRPPTARRAANSDS